MIWSGLAWQSRFTIGTCQDSLQWHYCKFYTWGQGWLLGITSQGCPTQEYMVYLTLLWHCLCDGIAGRWNLHVATLCWMASILAMSLWECECEGSIQDSSTPCTRETYACWWNLVELAPRLSCVTRPCILLARDVMLLMCLTCYLIAFYDIAFHHFHDHIWYISVEQKEKLSHTKFYMNQFMRSYLGPLIWDVEVNCDVITSVFYRESEAKVRVVSDCRPLSSTQVLISKENLLIKSMRIIFVNKKVSGS